MTRTELAVILVAVALILVLAVLFVVPPALGGMR
jgi:hypothetical protein